MFVKVKLVLFLLLALAAPSLYADASEVHEPDVIVLSIDTIHEGDYFAWGKSIEISGTVNGDVYLFGEQIIIDGTINGDVLACGGSIDISGTVSHSVRALAGQTLISGKVGSHVTVIAGNLQVPPPASIGASVVAIAGNVELAGQVGGEATVIGSNLRVSSEIKNNLKGYVGHMRITSRARIGGNVDYRSNTPAWIDQGAIISGALIHHPSFVHELVKGTWIQKLLVGSKVVVLMMNFFYTLVIGMILLKFFPKNVEAALSSLREAPWKALGSGIVFLVLLPLASLILLMTVLGIPFAITLIAANIIGLYSAKIYCIVWGANRLFSRLLSPNSFSVLFLGIIAYFILTRIPLFGPLLAFIATLFGLGAGILAQVKRNAIYQK